MALVSLDAEKPSKSQLPLNKMSQPPAAVQIEAGAGALSFWNPFTLKPSVPFLSP
jgi:hypothetical protein